MKHLAVKTLNLAAIVLAVGMASAGPARADPDDRLVIKGMLEQYAARFNQADAVGVAELFDQDVIYYGPLGQVFEGRDAVEERYRQNLEAGFADMRIETLEVDVIGETAWDIARYTVLDPKGNPLEGYHLAILKKVDGEWRVQRTLVNAVMPPPPSH